MGMDQEQFEQKAQQLTTRVERQQNVSDELNAMPFQERLEMARRMDSINADNRSTNPKLPDIELVVKKDGGGQEHLMDMTVRTKGKLWDSTTDVYDMPTKVEKNFLDYIANTQTTRDLLDSNSRFGVRNPLEQ